MVGGSLPIEKVPVLALGSERKIKLQGLQESPALTELIQFSIWRRNFTILQNDWGFVNISVLQLHL